MSASRVAIVTHAPAEMPLAFGYDDASMPGLARIQDVALSGGDVATDRRALLGAWVWIGAASAGGPVSTV